MIAIDGRSVWFHDDAVVVRDETKRPVWQGVMIDITEQKRVEEQLREAESRSRALVEHIPAVTYREALDANPADFYISPQVETVFGHDAKEWTWTPGFWRDHLHPQDRDRAWKPSDARTSPASRSTRSTGCAPPTARTCG